MTNRKILKIIIVASIYISLCFILQNISFGPIQLRVSELLCLLTIENPAYIISIGLGCLISNLLFSPFGIIDALVGAAASIAGCSLGYMSRKIKYRNFPLLSAFIISLVNAIVVSAEIDYLISNNMFIYSFIEILISESIVLIFFGYPIYNKLRSS